MGAYRDESIQWKYGQGARRIFSPLIGDNFMSRNMSASYFKNSCTVAKSAFMKTRLSKGFLTNLSNVFGRFSGKGKFWNVCLEIIGESWFCTDIQAL